MKRFYVSMSEEEIDLFEEKRLEYGMNKSSFIRYLMAEHENAVPPFLKYKEVISAMSDINTTMKQILITKKIDTTEKMVLHEKISRLNETLISKL